VNEAKQEREKIINEAWEAYNKVIPQAKGEAQKMIQEAEGYALQRVNNARGDAQRFIQVYREYVKAKDVTRRRLYLETMREILPQIDQIYVVDAQQKNIIPLLQMIDKGEQK
jgi:membrane protease subunit HflK